MEETNDTAQSFSYCSQQNPALGAVFYSCKQVICYPRPRKKEWMVSVHLLDVTFKMNKGTMLPPALTREGPARAGSGRRLLLGKPGAGLGDRLRDV